MIFVKGQHPSIETLLWFQFNTMQKIKDDKVFLLHIVGLSDYYYIREFLSQQIS